MVAAAAACMLAAIACTLVVFFGTAQARRFEILHGDDIDEEELLR